MKVGTDGTLLGCWLDVENANNILDIGTGTGVIAIMCAQKNPSAKIEALEIDEGAMIDAQFNINQLDDSWKRRILLHNKSVQDFKIDTKYDVIVSNPPFFEKSQLNMDDAKIKARHTESLHYSEILSFAQLYLSEKGSVSLILPYENGINAIESVKELDLFLKRVCKVFPNPDKKAHRLLLEFSKQEFEVETSTLTIETGIKRHEYTEEYMKLGKAFYLYF